MTWWKRAAVAVTVASVAAGGLVALGASPAAASASTGTFCYYGDKKYSHGAIIVVGEIKLKCNAGSWEEVEDDD